MRSEIQRQLRSVLRVLELLTVIATAAQGQKLISSGYLFNSDPTCREIDGHFTLVTTHDPFTAAFRADNTWYNGMYDYHLYTTTDFDTWEDHGSIISAQDVAWGKGTIWDGDAAIPANGRYYAYVPVRVSPDNLQDWGHFKLSVLVAEHPEGAYHDALGHPMRDIGGQDIFGLSPTVIKDDHGVPYLLWGGDNYANSVHIAKLAPNMVELAEPIRTIPVEIKNHCGGMEYIESPIEFEREGRWYLTYVTENGHFGKNCNFSPADPVGAYIEYAVSDSMFGPFDKGIRHAIFPPKSGETGNVHQGVCTFRDKWYIAYHEPSRFQNEARSRESAVNYSEGLNRQVTVTELRFQSDGAIEPIYPSMDHGAGVRPATTLLLDAFAPRREAQEYIVQEGAWPKRADKGGYHVMLAPGGYLEFPRVDFGRGAIGIKASLICVADPAHGTSIEFRLDSLDGPQLGLAPLGGLKPIGTSQIITTTAKPVPGVHNLFLRLTSQQDHESAPICGLDWFSFMPSFDSR